MADVNKDYHANPIVITDAEGFVIKLNENKNHSVNPKKP